MYIEKFQKIDKGEGTASDMVYIAWCLLYGDEVDQDVSSGVAWLERVAAMDSPDVLIRLGNLYETGEIVERDCGKTCKYYALGAQCEDFFGPYAFAIAYYFGSPCFPQDLAQALKYFRQAGAHGHLVSEAQSARLMRSGRFGNVSKMKGYFLPIKIGLTAFYLILTRKVDYEFRDADRWLPQSSWLKRIRKGMRFE